MDAQSAIDGDAYIKALHDLSMRSEPAILIMLVRGDTQQDHETRKRAAAWFKQNRDRLAIFAKGVIRVEHTHHHGDADADAEADVHRHATEAENSNFSRMLPFPIKHANTLDDAFDMAHSWPSA